MTTLRTVLCSRTTRGVVIDQKPLRIERMKELKELVKYIYYIYLYLYRSFKVAVVSNVPCALAAAVAGQGKP